jgi:hypothetical protein
MQQLGELTGPGAWVLRYRGQQLELGDGQRVFRVSDSCATAQRPPEPGDAVGQSIRLGVAACRQPWRCRDDSSHW